jgi:hypothetical protein
VSKGVSGYKGPGDGKLSSSGALLVQSHTDMIVSALVLA